MPRDISVDAADKMAGQTELHIGTPGPMDDIVGMWHRDKAVAAWKMWGNGKKVRDGRLWLCEKEDGDDAEARTLTGALDTEGRMHPRRWPYLRL